MTGVPRASRDSARPCGPHVIRPRVSDTTQHRPLGAAARAADRIRRAEQIRKRISDLADDHELISLELDDVVGLLDALDTASDHLPSDSDVVTAVLAARDAAKRVTDLQTEAEEAGEADEAGQRAADASAAAVARHCDEHDLPRTRAEVADVLTALSE